MKKEMDELKKQIEMHEKQNNVLQSVILAKDSALRVLTSRLEALQEEQATTAVEPSREEAEKVKDLQEKLQGKEQVIRNLCSRLERANVERRAIERELRERREQENSLYLENQQLRTECATKRAQCDHLRKESTCLRDSLVELERKLTGLANKVHSAKLAAPPEAKSTELATAATNQEEPAVEEGKEVKEVYEDSVEWPRKSLGHLGKALARN